MTEKFGEGRKSTGGNISLEEVDAEHLSQSVRERIDIAVRAKSRGKHSSIFFFEFIEEAAEDFISESMNTPENRQKIAEIRSAYNNLLYAFGALKENLKGDRVLDRTVCDVMWSSFLIGLACDWDKDDSVNILKEYKSKLTYNARQTKNKNNDRWREVVYNAVCSSVLDLMLTGTHMEKATKTYIYAQGLFDHVQKKISESDADEDIKNKKLTVYAVKVAVCRYLDEGRIRSLRKRKKALYYK